MSQEKLEKIFEVCNRYQNNPNVNYYELFNLNSNMSVEEIQNNLKQNRFKVLFHPDQTNFIPQEFKDVFQIISSKYPEVENIFSSEEAKNSYDNYLMMEQEYLQNQEVQEEPQEEYLNEKFILKQAIIMTANKYGTDYAIKALLQAINMNNYNAFTRDQNARDMVMQIPSQTLLAILLESSIDDMKNSTNINADTIVYNYFSDLIQKEPYFINKSNALETAITKTFFKYDIMKYNGKIPSLDKLQTFFAIDQYKKREDPSGFTKTENARNILMNYVRPDEVDALMILSLNAKRFENPNYIMKNSKNMGPSYMTEMYIGDIYLKNQNYGEASYK